MRSMRKLLKSLRSTSTSLLSRKASVRRRLPIRSFERVGVGLRRSSRGSNIRNGSIRWQQPPGDSRLLESARTFADVMGADRPKKQARAARDQEIGSDLVCPSGTRCGRPKENSEHAHLKVGASHNLQVPTRGALHAYII